MSFKISVQISGLEKRISLQVRRKKKNHSTKAWARGGKNICSHCACTHARVCGSVCTCVCMCVRHLTNPTLIAFIFFPCITLMVWKRQKAQELSEEAILAIIPTKQPAMGKIQSPDPNCSAQASHAIDFLFSILWLANVVFFHTTNCQLLCVSLRPLWTFPFTWAH